LLNVGPPDKDGRRALAFELNGIGRQTSVVDKSIAPKAKARPKADPAKPLEVAAPIPGMITSISASVGEKVKPGDKLLSLEAMKMHTVIAAPSAGVVDEIFVAVGETVESKDLLVRLRA
jgi:pyruvate carboxylase